MPKQSSIYQAQTVVRLHPSANKNMIFVFRSAAIAASWATAVTLLAMLTPHFNL